MNDKPINTPLPSDLIKPLKDNPSLVEEIQKFWECERNCELKGDDRSLAERIRDACKSRGFSPIDHPEIRELISSSQERSDKSCSCSNGSCICFKIFEWICNKLFSKKNDNQVADQSPMSPQASSSNNNVNLDVVFVAMTLKKNIVDDPVILFQKANSYWIGSKGDWKEKCHPLEKNIKTFNTIEDIDKDGFVFVIYEIKIPQNHVPQGCLGIQNALRNKNVFPHYAIIDLEIGSTFLHDFKQG